MNQLNRTITGKHGIELLSKNPAPIMKFGKNILEIEYDVENNPLAANYGVSSPVSSPGKLAIVENLIYYIFPLQHKKGKIANIVSLLPNEEVILNESYSSKITDTSKTINSFLESNQTDLENSLSENEKKEWEKASDSAVKERWNASVSAKGGFLSFGSVSASAGLSNESSQNRKNVEKLFLSSNHKQNSKFSHKKERNISISNEQAVSTDVHNSMGRSFKNTNAGKCLNIVFRNVFEHMVTIKCITDVEFFFLSADGKKSYSSSIYQLNEFVTAIAKDGHYQMIANDILEYLKTPINETGDIIINNANVNSLANLAYSAKFDYRPFDHEPTPGEGPKFKLDIKGPILNIENYYVNTGEILAEAAVGTGVALDEYNLWYQESEINNRNFINENLKLQNNLFKFSSDKITDPNSEQEEKEFHKQLVLEILKNKSINNV